MCLPLSYSFNSHWFSANSKLPAAQSLSHGYAVTAPFAQGSLCAFRIEGFFDRLTAHSDCCAQFQIQPYVQPYAATI